MPTCLLCKHEFKEKRGLNDHYRRKMACVPQSRVLELYKSLHQLLKYKDDLNYGESKNKEEIEAIFDCVESSVSNVELNPVYEKINEFGKENTSKLDEIYKQIERAGENGFKVYVKTLYCNKALPENRNIKITSMTGRYCKVFQDDDWNLECYEDIMLKLAKRYWDDMKASEHPDMQEYLGFMMQVVKKRDDKSRKKFFSYTKKHILPIFYNQTKKDKEFSYLIPNKKKKKVVKRN